MVLRHEFGERVLAKKKVPNGRLLFVVGQLLCFFTVVVSEKRKSRIRFFAL